MDSPVLVAGFSVLATLAACGAIGASALLAKAYYSQRERLAACERQRDELKSANAGLQAEIKHLQFIRGNKLYSRAQQDLGFAARQTLLRLRAIRAEVNAEYDVMEKLLNTEGK